MEPNQWHQQRNVNQQKCTAGKRNICHAKKKKMLLQGVSARFLLWCSEFILAAFLIKPGQMAEVLSNVFITRPHSTNGYLPEWGLAQVSSKWILLRGQPRLELERYLSAFLRMCAFHLHFRFEVASVPINKEAEHTLLFQYAFPAQKTCRERVFSLPPEPEKVSLSLAA